MLTDLVVIGGLDLDHIFHLHLSSVDVRTAPPWDWRDRRNSRAADGILIIDDWCANFVCLYGLSRLSLGQVRLLAPCYY